MLYCLHKKRILTLILKMNESNFPISPGYDSLHAIKYRKKAYNE